MQASCWWRGFREQPVGLLLMRQVPRWIVAMTKSLFAAMQDGAPPSEVGLAVDWKTWIVAGDARFTVETPQTHYTYRVKHVPSNGRWPDAWFVSLLSGPDNESDYTYMGKLVDLKIVVGGKSTFRQDSYPVKLLNRVLANLDTPEKYEAHGYRLHHEGKCGCCGRTLTTPESVLRGIGPVCWERRGER